MGPQRPAQLIRRWMTVRYEEMELGNVIQTLQFSGFAFDRSSRMTLRIKIWSNWSSPNLILRNFWKTPTLLLGTVLPITRCFMGEPIAVSDLVRMTMPLGRKR